MIKNNTIEVPNSIKSLVLLALIIGVGYLSFSVESQQTAYLFPQLLAIVLAITLGSDIILTFRNKSDAEKLVLSLEDIKRFAPGFFLVLIYTYFAEVVGFYMMSWLFVFSSMTYYNQTFLIFSKLSSESQTKAELWKKILKDLFYSLFFVFIMYQLFTVLLHVQTPRGSFF
jgi:hypothetical protein